MRRILVLLAAIACVSFLVPSAGAKSSEPRTTADAFSRKVKSDAIFEHLKALQAIADANGGTRASITPGYTASVDYVVRNLNKVHYNVTVQPFEFQFVGETAPSAFERVTPTPRAYVNVAEYQTMAYTGSGNVTARIRPVDVVVPIGSNPPNTSSSGCEATDFTNAGFQAGEVALMQRGTCSFRIKAENAKAAGASAVIVFNEGQAPDRNGVVAGTLNPPATIFDRPVIGTSYAIGAELVELHRANPNVTVHIFVQAVAETRTSYNVLAETRCGDPNNIDMSGAHLDSVPAGPGINDNGTGSAQQLEVALALARHFRANKGDNTCLIRNKVRFAWWGAEEQGLIGSRHYANTLTPEERAKIDLYLNYDMNGSPNYVRFIGAGTVGGPPGSDDIERVYAEWFASVGLATDRSEFNNRSDYGAFTPFGIPAGFLFTGAEGIKTPAQAAIFGGTAGAPYDACYHSACDRITNVNRTVLLQMARSAAGVLICWTTAPPLDQGVGGPAPGACFRPTDQSGDN